MTLDVDATKKAIHDWVVAGTQLTATSVLWAGQDKAKRPVSGAWATLRIVSDRDRGMGWTTETDADSPVTPGQELKVEYENMSEALLRIEVRHIGASDSFAMMAVLRRLRASRQMESQQDLLRAANVGLLSVEDVRDGTGGIQSTLVEPRATLDVRLQLASSLVEYITHIETVEITGEIDH